jgi:hypothetical protein
VKNYANAKERELFTVILACEEYLKIFARSEFISEQEQKKVNNAIRNLNEMKLSVEDRLGYVFLKKIKSFLDGNHLGFYAKGIVRDKVLCEIDDDVINDLLEDAGWSMDCVGCDRENHTECRCYKIFVEMGKDGNGKATGCPFR